MTIHLEFKQEVIRLRKHKARMSDPSPHREHRSERLYFAFGSNLHLGQMARRCPESRFIGTAILQDYRFQINQRGFANTVYSPGDQVEGLVYLLSRFDEERLDRSEGVPTAYQKYLLPVEVNIATIAHVGRVVPELAQQLAKPELHPIQSEASTRSTGSHHQSRGKKSVCVADNKGTWSPNLWRHLTGEPRQLDTRLQATSPGQTQALWNDCQTTKALVYMSKSFQEEAKPRDEYIDRMNAGIIDARKLGISDAYIDRCLRRHIRDRPLPRHGSTLTEHRNQGGRVHLQMHSKHNVTSLADELSLTKNSSRHQIKILISSARPNDGRSERKADFLR